MGSSFLRYDPWPTTLPLVASTLRAPVGWGDWIQVPSQFDVECLKEVTSLQVILPGTHRQTPPTTL